MGSFVCNLHTLDLLELLGLWVLLLRAGGLQGGDLGLTSESARARTRFHEAAGSHAGSFHRTPVWAWQFPLGSDQHPLPSEHGECLSSKTTNIVLEATFIFLQSY